MTLNSLQTRLKKFLKYLGLGSLTALLTLVLGLGVYPTVTGIARGNAAVPDSSVVPLSTHQASSPVQEGLQRYQSGQFAAAATLWQQAAETFATQGDRLNQAMVLSNLAQFTN
jgi:hypothetical protein